MNGPQTFTLSAFTSKQKSARKWTIVWVHTITSRVISLWKHPFLLALRRWGRFARRNVCDSVAEIPYWWRKSMLLNKSGSPGVPHVNLFNYRFLLIDFPSGEERGETDVFAGYTCHSEISISVLIWKFFSKSQGGKGILQNAECRMQNAKWLWSLVIRVRKLSESGSI